MVNLVKLFGLLTFICLLAGAIIGYLVQKGKIKISWHKVIGGLALIFALVHLVFIYLR